MINNWLHFMFECAGNVGVRYSNGTIYPRAKSVSLCVLVFVRGCLPLVRVARSKESRSSLCGPYQF